MGEGHDPTNNRHGSSLGNNIDGDFECNICFDLARDPVITLCGHLYCWQCIYRWVRGFSISQECPVCKSVVEEEKVIPLYGRGETSIDRPRDGWGPPTAFAGVNNFGMYPVFSNYGYHDSFLDSEGQMNGDARPGARIDGQKLKKILWVTFFCVIFVFLTI